MITIEDNGIIINIKPYGETSVVVTIFSETHGLIKGYVKGGRTLKNSGIYQKGNLIAFEHQKKLPHQLGTIKGETILCLWHIFSDNHFSFYSFNALCDLILETLGENICEEAIYHDFTDLLKSFCENSQSDIEKEFSLFLLNFLSYLGFMPAFHRCGVSGTKENLIYVSPKTGHAISKEVGQDYHNKLLPLPAFLKDETVITTQEDIKNAIRLLGFLIEKYLFFPQNKTIPESFLFLYEKI